jgi:hypothetical protein
MSAPRTILSSTAIRAIINGRRNISIYLPPGAEVEDVLGDELGVGVGAEAVGELVVVPSTVAVSMFNVA